MVCLEHLSALRRKRTLFRSDRSVFCHLTERKEAEERQDRVNRELAAFPWKFFIQRIESAEDWRAICTTARFSFLQASR